MATKRPRRTARGQRSVDGRRRPGGELDERSALEVVLGRLPLRLIAAKLSSAGETVERLLDLCVRIEARARKLGIPPRPAPTDTTDAGGALRYLRRATARHRGGAPVPSRPAPAHVRSERDATDPNMDLYAREAFELQQQLAPAALVIGAAGRILASPPLPTKPARLTLGGREYASAAQALAAVVLALAAVTTRWDIQAPGRYGLRPRPFTDAELAFEASLVLHEAARTGASRDAVRTLSYAAALEAELLAQAATQGLPPDLRGPGETGEKFLAALRATGRPLPARRLIPAALRRPDNSKDRTHLAVLVEQGHLVVGRRRGQGYMLPEWEGQDLSSQTEPRPGRT